MIDLDDLREEMLDGSSEYIASSEYVADLAIDTIAYSDDSGYGPYEMCRLTGARFLWPGGFDATYPTSWRENAGVAQALVAMWLGLDQEEAEETDETVWRVRIRASALTRRAG